MEVLLTCTIMHIDESQSGGLPFSFLCEEKEAEIPWGTEAKVAYNADLHQASFFDVAHQG